MGRIKLFSEGDVLLTNPEEGFWGIAVVLSEREKTEDHHPMCHIAITPIIRQRKIEFSGLKMEELKPLEFERAYALKDVEEFSEIETCIGVYTRRNKEGIEIIGSINPKIVYDGPLPFEPSHGLEITWPLYGDTDGSLGREAYITWKRQQAETEN